MGANSRNTSNCLNWLMVLNRLTIGPGFVGRQREADHPCNNTCLDCTGERQSSSVAPMTKANSPFSQHGCRETGEGIRLFAIDQGFWNHAGKPPV